MRSKLNYEGEILKLKREADRSRGITWPKESDLLLGKTLRRTLVDIKEDLYAQEDYAQQILNLCRATKEIIDIEAEKKSAEELKEFVDKFALEKLEKYTQTIVSEKNAIADLRKSNAMMVELLKNGVFKEKKTKAKINKTLRLAEAYAGLNDRPYDIETVTKIGGKTFIQRSERISTLTEEQKKFFSGRKKLDWYRSLSKIERGLIDRHIGQLTDGEHVISCIIKNIPGARNAYKRTLLQVEGKKEKVLNFYLHSAGIHSFNPERAEEIAKQNYEQLRQNSGSKVLKFATLASELPLGATDLSESLDKKLVEQTRLAAGENFINLPINSLRGISGKNYKDYSKAFLEKFAEGQNKLPKLSSYLAGNGFLGFYDIGGISRKMAMKEISNSNLDNVEKSRLNELVELKRLSVERFGLFGRVIDIIQSIVSSIFKTSKTQSNDSVKIASLLTRLAGASEDAFLISCKSGKDRTGYISYKADAEAIVSCNPELNIENAENNLGAASHAQFLASCSGGKTGCFGIKRVQIDGDLEPQKKLFASAARRSSNIKLVDLTKEEKTSISRAIEKERKTSFEGANDGQQQKTPKKTSEGTHRLAVPHRPTGMQRNKG